MRLRTRASCLAAPALFVALSLSSLAGCSSSPSSSTGAAASTADAVPTATQGLAGEYVADDTSSSDLRSITFVDDTRYLLQPTTCPDSDDCREQGWYTLTGDEVALHDDLGDPVETFSLAVLDSGTVPDATTDDGSDADAGVIRGTDSLVGGSGSIVHGSYQVFALSMTGGGSRGGRYHLVNSTGALVNASNASTLVTPTTTGALVGSSLLFEGSCNFLHSCSSFSKTLPAGEVSWGCVGVKACSDTTHWLAGPSRAYCGKTVTVCKGTTCTTGTVLDVSNAGAWEGSEGLLGAVGLPYGLTGTCSGYGGGMVTIKD